MNKFFLPVALMAAALPSNMFAGKIVVFADEWQTSNAAATPANAGAANVTQLVQNISAFFGGGNFLIFSDNFSLTDVAFSGVISGETYNTTPGFFTLANLNTFSGVFFAGGQAGYDANILAQYVNGGGDVYIAAGTLDGPFGGAENAYWNPFLNQFGLTLGPDYNGVVGTLPVASGHPVVNGVTQIYTNNGNTVSLFGSNPNASIIYSAPNGAGLIGVYDSTVPEPSTWMMLSAGLVGLGLVRHRIRR